MTVHEDEVEAWRAARYRRISAPDGWLALIGKYPLAPGRSNVTVERPGGASVEVAVNRAEPRIVVRANGGDEHDLAAGALTMGSLRFELLRRGDEAYLRVKDAEAKARTEFRGLPHYPVDPTWRIAAKLAPFAEKTQIDLDYEEGGLDSYRSPGHAVFAMGGKERRVLLLEDGDRPRLFVLFRDATSRDTTYGAGRFLYAPLPKDGEVVLDFNQAFSPPCALTPWASCPIVPRENVLDLRIEAGEMRPPE